MAQSDVNKSINIDMKMDISNLRKNLAAIPGMTKKEASAMTAALAKELRKAQAQAKKTAKVNKQAMKKMQVDFKQTENAAKKVRLQSREMGAAFGSLEDVVGEIAPELQGLTTTLGTVGQAGRSLSRGLATGNPVILALIVGTAALAAGYTVLTSAAREAERQQKLLNEANEQAVKKYAEQAAIVRAIAADQTTAIREQKVLFGELSESEKERLDLRDQISAKTKDQIDKQQKILDKQKELVKLATIAGNSSSELSEEQQKTLEIAMKQSKLESVRVGLMGTQAGISTQMVSFKRELLQNLAKEEGFQQRIVDENQQTFDIMQQTLQAREELRKEQEEEEKRQERIRAAQEAAAKRQRALEQARAGIQQIQVTTQKNIENAQIKLLDKEDQISAKYKQQIDQLEAQKDALLDNAIQAEEAAKTQAEKQEAYRLEQEALHSIALINEEQNLLEMTRLKEVDEFKQKQHEKEQQRLEKENKEAERLQKQRISNIKAGIQVSIQGLQQFTTAGLELLETTGNKNKTLLNVLFRANQAAAIANIAMSTAEAMAKALALGPAAPVAQALILAGAAAQTGVVLSQTPPVAHMGGFIKPLSPGEQTRTVLEGEAVLDRATTRRIGGEAGVRALQEGRTGDREIVVLSPFKHLDRYNRSALRNRRSAFGELMSTNAPRY